MPSSHFALAVCLALVAVNANEQALGANPIRKVVNMLQAMQKKVEAEGEKEQVLFDKFMCYCKNSGGDLSKSIGDADTKIPQLGADIKEAEAKNAQLKEDLKQHQVDRSAAKAAVAEATALREKDAAAFSKESSESKATIASITKAVSALESGMAGAFLQTRAASILRHLAAENKNIQEEDRQVLSAFLQGSQSSDYSPSSGQITGILKTMGDEMSKSLADATAAEAEAVKAFDSLTAAKTKEINALTAALETKMTRTGELSVEIVQMKNDLGDTEEALIADKAFLADMEKNCAKKAGEWEAIVKTRSEELLALADTIKVLNDDDALELFKKAIPASSFVQVSVSTVATRNNALAEIRKAHSPKLDFIALAIQGKKIGFEAVIKMIDEMSATLKQEQLDDDHKKEYCAKQFDLADDKKKGLERSVADLETAIADAKDGIANSKSEIKALESSLKALDRSVADATEQRKEENAEFTELMSSDSAAKEILAFAKNRLNKFYNPKQYVAPPKRVLTDEDRATLAAGGTLAPTAAPSMSGVAQLVQVGDHNRAAPPPPPEAPGAYKKKGQETNGVVAMIDLIIKDLDKEMTVAKTEEKDAQGDYETMMKDSASKRADDSKMLADKEGTLADLQASLEASTENKASTTKELGATVQYIASLHAECDWLLQYFEVRREARTSEIDALGKAKAVLSGADFSFLQVASNKAPEDELAKEMTHDLEMNFNKIAPFGKEDTAKELQDHAAKTQDTLVDAVENAEVAEIKRAVFRALTRLRAATIKEFDTIARLETQAIDAYNDAHHYRAENPLAHLHEDEAPVETDKLKSFH